MATANRDSSPPEFLIQRNLILQKRSASVADEEDSRNRKNSESSDVSSGGALKDMNDGSGGAPTFKGVHPAETGSPSVQSTQRLHENRTRGNTASAGINRRTSPLATSRMVAAESVLPESVISEKETIDWDASSKSALLDKREFRQGLARTGRKMGEDFTDVTPVGRLQTPSSDSGSDVSVNNDVRRIIQSSEYRKNRLPNGVSKGSNSPQEQEFSYGPGFVDKLKSRFISLSLQEKSKTGNGLRRFSSLENVLDSDAEYPIAIDVIKRKRPNGTATAWNRFSNKHTAPSRGSFKRAKSMETLLMESEHRKGSGRLGNCNKSAGHRPVSMIEAMPSLTLGLINENLIIIESTKGEPTSPDTNLNNNRDKSKNNANRQVSIISDEELPKPDIVKNCKLIFETVGKNKNGGSTRKVITATTIPRSAKTKSSNGLTNGASTLPKTFAAQQVGNNAKEVLVVNGEEGKVNGNRPSLLLAKETGTKHRVVSPDVITNGEATPVIVDAEIKKEFKVITEPDVIEEMKAPVVKLNRVASPVVSPVEIKRASPTNSAPLVKNSTARPPFLKAEITSPEESAKEIITTTPTQNVEINKPGNTTNRRDDPPKNSQLENITPVPSTNNRVEATSPTIESPEDDVLKPSTLLGNKKPGLWQKAPQMTTTVVYDFRGKEVKSHLPTNPAPFGCKPAKVKKKKKPVDGKEGLPLKNGVDIGDFGGESNDYDSDDDSDDFDAGFNLPIKSGINFIGENAKCSRSSILITRNKKLKIQFNDDATSTFEYPSEEWIYEDTTALLNTNNLLDTVLSPDNQRPQPTSDLDEETDKGPNTGLRNSPGVTSIGGLSSYTPSKLSSTESSFQLGVSSRLPPKEEVSPTPKEESSVSSTNGTNAEEDDLLPADPEQTSSWSSSTSTSDLLF